MTRIQVHDVRRSKDGKDIMNLEHIPIEVPTREHYFDVLERCELKSLSASQAWGYGDRTDGVVELAALSKDGGMIEIGSYYGTTKPKSIIKISSQIGCPASCKFCEVGDEKFKRNLTATEMFEQVGMMVQILSSYLPEYSRSPHKINIAGTGEPLLNPNIIDGMKLLMSHNFTLKMCSIMPSSPLVLRNFHELASLASDYHMPIQPQVSLLSLNEEHRRTTAGIRLLSFDELSKLGRSWNERSSIRKQVNLSLILTEDCPIDFEIARRCFSPEYFCFRFRDYVTTSHGQRNEKAQMQSERVLELKEQFRSEGYRVTDDATPTPTEQEWQLASNVTRRRMMVSFGQKIDLKKK